MRNEKGRSEGGQREPGRVAGTKIRYASSRDRQSITNHFHLILFPITYLEHATVRLRVEQPPE